MHAQTDMHISPIPHHGHNSLINPQYQIASPEVNSCPIWTGQVAKSIYRPDKRVYHLRIAVVAWPPPRNLPQKENYFDFVPLLPPDQIASSEVNSCVRFGLGK